MPSDNPNCKACGLYRGNRTVCVSGEGPEDASVIFIGEAPGDTEDKQGRPFIGKSGQIIRAEIEKAGLNGVRITNLVRCRPPANRTPTLDEIKACRPYLDAELAKIKPAYVVTLGATASKAVLRKSKITQDHGLIVRKDGFIGMPMFHPAYILRDPSKLPALQQDLKRLVMETRGERKQEELDWRFLTKSNINQFIKEFIAAERFAFDTETTGLFMHSRTGKVRTLQISFDHRTWVIRLNMLDSPMPKHETQYTFLQWMMSASRGKWICAQNGKFDNLWLMVHYGVRFHLDFDAGLAHHLIDENTPHGLKEMVRTYLDGPDYDLPLQKLLDPGGHGCLPEFYLYSARDAHYTLKLALLFDGMLKKNRVLRQIFYKLVMPAARAFEVIENTGITLDMHKFAETKIDVAKRRDECERELNKMAKKAGGVGISWTSPQQVGKFLYGTLGIKPTVLTDGGAPSTGEEALLEIRDEHPIATKLVEFRELSKFYNTYLEGWEELIIDDRVYFSTKLHGTVTGRYSSRLHQVPRDGTIRNLAIAPPRYSFVQADLSQAELRIVAEVSHDQEMLKCFKENIDIHWKTLMFVIQSGGSGDYYEPLMETATRFKKKKITDIEEAVEIMMREGHEAAIASWKGWKEGRKKAKGINFGFVYGMGPPKFVEYAKMKYGFEPTLREAENLREAFFSLYRGLEPWHRKQRGLVKLNGEVRNLIGRVRRLPGAQSTDRSLVSEAERQAINSPIQGFIGDLKAMALVEISETLPFYSVKIVGEVHDSILLNVRTDELDEWLPKIRQIMRHPKLLDEFKVKLNVPLECDIEVGPWGNGVPYKKDLQ